MRTVFFAYTSDRTYNDEMDVPGAIEFTHQKGLKKQWFGGGNSQCRTLTVLVGMTALKWQLMLEKTHLCVYCPEDPDLYDWTFTDGHDIWIRPCGFVQRSTIRKLADQVKPYAARILYHMEDDVKWSI